MCVQIAQRVLHISGLEMRMVVVGLKTWGHQLGRAKLRVYCDNEATVLVINSGKSRDSFMQQCLTELCYVTAKAQCVLRAVHLPGDQNRLPDLLSRWQISKLAREQFRELNAG